MRYPNYSRNFKRAQIARALRNELGMNNYEIGDYMGLHNSSVSHLIRRGTTSGNGKKYSYGRKFSIA